MSYSTVWGILRNDGKGSRSVLRSQRKAGAWCHTTAKHQLSTFQNTGKRTQRHYSAVSERQDDGVCGRKNSGSVLELTSVMPVSRSGGAHPNCQRHHTDGAASGQQVYGPEIVSSNTPGYTEEQNKVNGEMHLPHGHRVVCTMLFVALDPLTQSGP